MLRHIALDVHESDIQDFYIELLGGKITRQFTLDEAESESLFQVSGQIEVYKLNLNDLELELFVHESIIRDCIQHLCLEMINAQSIYSKAKESGYCNRIRNSGKNETYFLRDQNRNMFELKNKQ
jgi:glycyl-tRNA synthetase alpha subunit